MKITNVEEFANILNFYDSKDFFSLEKTDQEIVLKELKASVNSLEGVKEKMIFEIGCDLSHDFLSNFNGKKKKAFFIMSFLSDEQKIQVIKNYIEECKCTYINQELLLPLLDFLTDDKKIIAISRASNENLLKLMSDFNRCSKDLKRRMKIRKYYKNYYNICKKALERKELR